MTLSLRLSRAALRHSSSPSKSGFIELCVRRAGRFTEALHKMQCGDIVGIRGPFGRGFPFEKMRGHDILLVAGGLGIAPLRSLINNIHDERSDFGKVTIIYGSKTPQEVMFRNQFEMWRHRKDFDLYLTVDHPDDTWDGEVGLVTNVREMDEFYSKQEPALRDFYTRMKAYVPSAFLTAFMAIPFPREAKELLFIVQKPKGEENNG